MESELDEQIARTAERLSRLRERRARDEKERRTRYVRTRAEITERMGQEDPELEARIRACADSWLEDARDRAAWGLPAASGGAR